jgi:Domain of unknown function (DUF4174)
MRPILAFAALLMLALPAAGQDIAAAVAEAETQGDAPAAAEPAVVDVGPVDAAGHELAEYQWQRRLIVVFADTPRDPSYTHQLDLLADRPDELAARDVLIVTDSDPKAAGPIRIALRPRGFAMVIVDKDSKVLLRKPTPWDIREITRAIDKTPLRQQELRDARADEARRLGFPQ